MGDDDAGFGAGLVVALVRVAAVAGDGGGVLLTPRALDDRDDRDRRAGTALQLAERALERNPLSALALARLDRDE